MSTAPGTRCRARLLSDRTGQTVCNKNATSVDGRLCAFHSRQCQGKALSGDAHALANLKGLYRGYKRRNAQLETLSASAPPFLANAKVSLVNQTFEELDDKDTLESVFKYLFEKYNLLEKVIRGRKLHHSHFFAIDNDYGHEKYLNQLQKEKQIIEQSLDRLGKRSTQMLYKQKKWLDWVQERQDDEQREADDRKLKLEAQLFKRHQKEIERRQCELRAKENEKLQDAHLEAAYTQRLSEMSDEMQDEWDPILDVVEDEKETFIDLIEYFLLVKDENESVSAEENGNEASASATGGEMPPGMSKAAKKRAKKARAAVKAPSSKDPNARGPDTIEMETKAQIRKRLQEGVKYSRKEGYHVVGALETPYELYAKAAAIPDDEIDTLLGEIAEVKMLLFCRLLLSHAALLQIALNANSVDDFLHHPDVTSSSLRDLCLKLEKPALQDVRDACADFVRAKTGENEEDDNDDDGQEEEVDDEEGRRIPENYRMNLMRPDKSMPKIFKTKREQAAQKQHQRRRETKAMADPRDLQAVDFGEIEDGEEGNKKVRIKICGRYVNDYPSEKALSRGGWYHFCLIAKDSDLHDAIELCRNWNEFFELNTLCVYHYFPAAKWMVWVGDQQRLQLLRMGFIPYFQSDRADLLTVHEQTGSRGMARRAHYIREARNFICGHIKRNDPASRRLIQYLSMMTFELIILVRDAKTGKILVKPPKEERWLIREKVGWGRASRNEYKEIVSVGPKFFETMDKARKWHFNFDDHYDVYIWDASSRGRPFSHLYGRLMEILVKAHRVREPKDVYNVVGPIIKTLTRDPDTQRIRTIEPQEEVKSLWDHVNGPDAKFSVLDSQNGEEVPNHFDAVKYSEADALEDEILFPEEADEDSGNHLFKPDTSAMARVEQGDFGDMRRFVYDLDSDEESDFDEDAIDDDGDEDWEDEESEMDGDDDLYFIDEEDAKNWERQQKQSDEAKKAFDEFSVKFKDHLSLKPGSKQHFIFDQFNDPSKPLDISSIPEHMRKSDEDVMALMRLSLMKEKDYNDTSDETLRAQFERYLARQKSKVFKQSFHQADFTPNALLKDFIQSTMTRAMDDYQMSKITLGPFELIRSMRLVEKMKLDKRIVDDAFSAYASVSLFYEGDDLLQSKHGAMFSTSVFHKFLQEFPLLNQSERANQCPDRRTNQSNKMLPSDFWDGWDKLCKDNRRAMTNGMIEHFYPAEWDKVVRPKIARLYKAGIICNTYADNTAGVVVAHAEPGRELDMYIDFRLGLTHIQQLSHLQDPRKFTRSTLLTSARAFAKKYPDARFAALRIWSSDYFYPLMLGYWNRPHTSFIDSKGRGWEWKFIPKDMPFSEWSIHEQAWTRIRPFMDFFGDQVIVATDLYFVMGRNEAELRKLASGVTFAVQTESWRMEIDFWRSFVGVDLEFLEGLDKRWLETTREP